MRVIAAGGGTGGHVTPIRYVARELKKRSHEVIYVGHKGDAFAGLIEDETAVSSSYAISSGKWRRYQRSRWEALIDVKTFLLNIRDMFSLGRGFFESLSIIRREKPDVVFLKGGYVSVPVGMAAHFRGIPIVLHESDTLAGRANSLLARWAVKIAVAYSPSLYSYPKSKMIETGIPLHADFFELSKPDRGKLLHQLKLNPKLTTILVIGGSLGALSINNAMAKIALSLSEAGYQVVHIAGEKHKKTLSDQVAEINNYRVIGFVKRPRRLVAYCKAADIVISRAGATNIAELSALGKPSIIIPAQQLPDQLKNGTWLQEKGAGIVLNDREIEQNPNVLAQAIIKLVNSPADRQNYSWAIKRLSHENSASEVADVIISARNRDVS